MNVYMFFSDNDNDEYTLMTNNDGIKAIGNNGTYGIDDELFDDIISLINTKSIYELGYAKDIKDIISAELIFSGNSIKAITDKKKLAVLEDMLSNSSYIGGGSGCPFSAELVMKLDDGSEITAKIATDSCDSMILGSYSFFDYGTGPTEFGGENYQYKLFEILGIADWEELD